jgi:hypothetical protein
MASVKKADKFLGGNESLPININVDYTVEQASEMQKCMDDIIYFAENYFYIVNLDKGRQKIKLFDAQRDAILGILDNRLTVICASRQVGKAEPLDTQLPTPNGWTTLGELKDGDMVFDWYGNPTKVLKVHDTLYNRDCYELTFSNGEKLVADADHEWFTQSRAERRHNSEGSVKTTKQILDTLLVGQKAPEPQHRIPIKHCVNYPEKDLLIDPYLLGAWLGDGTSGNNCICSGGDDFDDMYNNALSHIENKTYSIRDMSGKPSHYKPVYIIRIQREKDNIPFTTKLKTLNVFKNKHIPIDYIQSSVDQRLALIQGLMDTDGHIEKRGICQFYTIIQEMAEQVKEILYSLGIQCNITSKIPKIKDKEYSRVYSVTFKTQLPVFRLKRKLEKLHEIKRDKVENNRNKFIYIKEIRQVPSVPVKCITVEHPEHMYLVGKTFIPTSNTTLLTVVCLWLSIFKKDYQIAILANREEQAKEILERIKLSYEELPNWLKTGVAEFTKEVLKLVNGSKIFVSTTTESGIRGKSVNLLFVDEFAHILQQIAEPFFKSVMPVVSSSTTSKVVLVSTPKNSTGKFYEIFRDAELGKNNWNAVRIHYSQVPGRDEAWKQQQLAAINHDMDLWNQEFELHFLENGAIALNKNIIEDLKAMCRDADFAFEEGEYLLWKEPKPGRIISIGVDVAEGKGGDYTVAIILDITDPMDIELCGIFASNKINPWVFAEKLNQIARSWGRPFLCIENNADGGTVIQALLEVHGYDNIVTYNMENDKRGYYQKPGIFCHQNAKNLGIQNMKYFLEIRRGVSIYSSTLVSEFESFIRKTNRIWGAKPGHHDDHVMALTWSLILLEKRLAEQYLEVHEYDDTGKPLIISDPNQHLADAAFTNISQRHKIVKDVGGHTQEFNIFFNPTMDKGIKIAEKYQTMIEECSWEFV